MVEQGTENPRVGGSIPSLGTILAGGPVAGAPGARDYRPPGPPPLAGREARLAARLLGSHA